LYLIQISFLGFRAICTSYASKEKLLAFMLSITNERGDKQFHSPTIWEENTSVNAWLSRMILLLSKWSNNYLLLQRILYTSSIHCNRDNTDTFRSVKADEGICFLEISVLTSLSWFYCQWVVANCRFSRAKLASKCL